MNSNYQSKPSFKCLGRGLVFSKVLLTAFVLLLSPPSFWAANAISWTEAIENVEGLHDKYAEELKERTGSMAIGSAFNGIDASMHRCAIVGRMLGLKDRVTQFEPPMPEMNGPDDGDIAYAIGSLDAWLPHGIRRCVDRCCPNTRQARRSETLKWLRT